MKKLMIATTILFLSTLTSFGQVTVDEVNINKLDIKYIRILGYNRPLFGKNPVIKIDYGQKFKWFKNQLVKDKNNKVITFNSIIDALNFMERNGWKYVNNNVTTDDNDAFSSFLLEKKEQNG